LIRHFPRLRPGLDVIDRAHHFHRRELPAETTNAFVPHRCQINEFRLYSRICGRAATAETDPLAGASSKKHGAGGSIGGGESV